MHVYLASKKGSEKHERFSKCLGLMSSQMFGVLYSQGAWFCKSHQYVQKE